MLVKICGISTKKSAHTALQSGADFIGFVFTTSTRQVTPEVAAAIAASLPSTIKKVGVFVNERKDRIEQIAKKTRLNFIQLHGDEPPALANSLSLPVIKAFPATKETLVNIEDYPCKYCLLDSPNGPYRGGNGTTFNWKMIEDLHLNDKRIILAGGLTPKNVQTAIETVRPHGVDVSSGVETDGKKDALKIRTFIMNAKNK
ncbi:MAG TPA: phosphoribosylanthranilate isomerase [Bacillota bacterium]